ncbi:helix-turn-helix transcriptional regulator [Streptomyces sp. M19]
MRYPPSELGPALREQRHRRGLSQLELASLAEVSARHLSFVENGRSRPGRELLLRLITALRVSAEQRDLLLMSAGYAPLATPAAKAGRGPGPGVGPGVGPVSGAGVGTGVARSRPVGAPGRARGAPPCSRVSGVRVRERGLGGSGRPGRPQRRCVNRPWRPDAGRSPRRR